MLVSIYYMLSLFNAHTMFLIVHIFMNVNKLCSNQTNDNEPLVRAFVWAGQTAPKAGVKQSVCKSNEISLAMQTGHCTWCDETVAYPGRLLTNNTSISGHNFSSMADLRKQSYSLSVDSLSLLVRECRVRTLSFLDSALDIFIYYLSKVVDLADLSRSMLSNKA